MNVFLFRNRPASYFPNKFPHHLARIPMRHFLTLYGLFIAVSVAACTHCRETHRETEATRVEACKCLLRVGEMRQQRSLFESALSSDQNALHEILFDTGQNIERKEEGEHPIYMSGIFLEAIGDKRFSAFLRSQSREDVLDIGFALTKMGAACKPLEVLAHNYPSTTAVLRKSGYVAFEARIKTAPISM